jgi:hypothetical protein
MTTFRELQASATIDRREARLAIAATRDEWAADSRHSARWWAGQRDHAPADVRRHTLAALLWQNEATLWRILATSHLATHRPATGRAVRGQSPVGASTSSEAL